MSSQQNRKQNHREFYTPEFEVAVSGHVDGIIDSLPEPEYRDALEKAGDYQNLASGLGIFVSGALVNYAIINNLNPSGLDWGALNINILDALNGLKEGKSIIDAIEDIIDYIDTVNSVDDFLVKITGDEDGTVVFDLLDEMLDAL